MPLRVGGGDSSKIKGETNFGGGGVAGSRKAETLNVSPGERGGRIG